MKFFISIIIGTYLLVLPMANFAAEEQPQQPTEGLLYELIQAGMKAGYKASDTNESSLPKIAGQVTMVALTLLGIVFVSLAVYAGYLWMTASGNSDRVDKAKEILISAVIGLFIVTAAYVITAYIITGIALVK